LASLVLKKFLETTHLINHDTVPPVRF